jgi:hypothetical protein
MRPKYLNQSKKEKTLLFVHSNRQTHLLFTSGFTSGPPPFFTTAAALSLSLSLSPVLIMVAMSTPIIPYSCTKTRFVPFFFILRFFVEQFASTAPEIDFCIYILTFGSRLVPIRSYRPRIFWLDIVHIDVGSFQSLSNKLHTLFHFLPLPLFATLPQLPSYCRNIYFIKLRLIHFPISNSNIKLV